MKKYCPTKVRQHLAAHERRSWEYASQGGRSYDCSPWHFVGGFHRLVMMHPLRLLQILVKVFEIHPKIVTIVGNILKIRLDVPLEHGNYAGGSPVGNVMMQFRPVVSQVFDIFPEILQVKPNVAQVSRHVAIMSQIFQINLDIVRVCPYIFPILDNVFEVRPQVTPVGVDDTLRSTVRKIVS